MIVDFQQIKKDFTTLFRWYRSEAEFSERLGHLFIGFIILIMFLNGLRKEYTYTTLFCSIIFLFILPVTIILWIKEKEDIKIFRTYSTYSFFNFN
jgi:hypothetical protein